MVKWVTLEKLVMGTLPRRDGHVYVSISCAGNEQYIRRHSDCSIV